MTKKTNIKKTPPLPPETRSVGGKELNLQQELVQVEGALKLQFEVLSEKKVDLNHELATKYIDLPIFEGERDVTESHAQFLYDEMRKGTFNEHLVILSTCEYLGKVYKINGQHTAWARLFMPENYQLRVTEIKYRVQTAEQLRMLYATYDRLMGRTDTHVTKIHLVNTPEMEGIAPSVIQRVVPGLKFWLFESSTERSRYTPEQVAALVRQHHAEVFRAVALFYGEEHQNPKLRRAPVLAAMFETFSRFPAKAAEFWRPVSNGLDLSAKTDPRYKLRDLLHETVMQMPSLGTKKHRRVMDNESLYRICIQAWNKWRAGEPAQGALRPTVRRLRAR